MKTYGFLPDLHLEEDNGQSYYIEKIQQHNPDILVVIGDLHRKGYCIDPSNLGLLEYLRSIRQRIVYLRGNHDPAKMSILGIKTKKKLKIITDDGRKIIAIHGDGFDRFLWLFDFEDVDWLCTKICRWFQKKQFFKRWTSAWLGKSNRIVEHFVTMAKGYAKRKWADAIICGHIHQADWQVFPIKRIGKTKMCSYYNCGHATGDTFSYVTLEADGQLNLHLFDKP